MTAARKAREQIEMFQRRFPDIMWAPGFSLASCSVLDERELRRAHAQAVVCRPVDLFLATTVHQQKLLVRIRRTHGDWPRSGLSRVRRRGVGSGTKADRHGRAGTTRRLVAGECFEDVLAYLGSRDLRPGKRTVLRRSTASRSDRAAQVLRERGAEVVVASIYRVDGPESPGRLTNF